MRAQFAVIAWSGCTLLSNADDMLHQCSSTRLDRPRTGINPLCTAGVAECQDLTDFINYWEAEDQLAAHDFNSSEMEIIMNTQLFGFSRVGTLSNPVLHALLVNGGLEGLTRHDGSLAVGGDLLVATMTVAAARERCVLLAGCKGFTFESSGEGMEQSQKKIFFKDRWAFNHHRPAWVSYKSNWMFPVLTVQSDDLRVLERIWQLMPDTCAGLRHHPCMCAAIGCSSGVASDGHGRRITTLTLLVHTETKVLVELSGLSELHALEIIQAEQWNRNIPTIPSLLSLAVDFFAVQAPEDRHDLLQWAGKHTNLVSLTLRSHWGLPLHELCGLPWLKVLKIPGFADHGWLGEDDLPGCLSKELTVLDVRGQMLKNPPIQLELPELRTFIAFRQGEKLTRTKNEKSRLSKIGCKLAEQLDMGTVMICPVMVCSVDAFLQLKWPRLEKLWLDGNFLSGSIPSSFLEQFPSLVSLDLYDNLISGAIPGNFGTQTFIKLQLHGNRFEGPLPPCLGQHLERHMVLTMHDNAGLSGCIPHSVKMHQVPVDGTQLRFCKEPLEL